MNLNYTAKCKLEYDDINKVIYAYSIKNTYDIDTSDENTDSFYGKFSIEKTYIEPAQVRSKVVMHANGKKELVQQRMISVPDIAKLIARGKIIVNVCKNEISTKDDSLPYFASSLIEMVFTYFQEKGEIAKELEFQG